jgi:hypothetical protein
MATRLFRTIVAFSTAVAATGTTACGGSPTGHGSAAEEGDAGEALVPIARQADSGLEQTDGGPCVCGSYDGGPMQMPDGGPMPDGGYDVDAGWAPTK